MVHPCPICQGNDKWEPIDGPKSEPKSDPVNHPNHYNMYPMEVKDIIKLVLDSTPGLTQFQSYCLGNELKYRLRAGFKGDVVEDINKAIKYKEFRDGSRKSN
jgi:hypothetical protein